MHLDLTECCLAMGASLCQYVSHSLDLVASLSLLCQRHMCVKCCREHDQKCIDIAVAFALGERIAAATIAPMAHIRVMSGAAAAQPGGSLVQRQEQSK